MECCDRLPVPDHDHQPQGLARRLRGRRALGRRARQAAGAHGDEVLRGAPRGRRRGRAQRKALDMKLGWPIQTLYKS